MELHFKQPGKLTRHASVESFNGKFRDHSLDLNWFACQEDARTTTDRWGVHSNEIRPHRSLGQVRPSAHARRAA